MDIQKYIEESKRAVVLLNIEDESMYKEFDSIKACKKYLGYNMHSNILNNPKIKKYSTVKHHTTKIKYYIKYKD